MPNRSRTPRDSNAPATHIVGLATEQIDAPRDADGKDPAVALGGKRGQKGGKARANALTPAQRRASAKKAATAR